MTRRDEVPTEVHRITGAAPSRSQDLDRRVNRYLISMAIRTACVVLGFVVPGPARWVFGAGAVFLPYVAVLLANASGRPAEAGPAPVERRGLGAAAASPVAPGPAGPGSVAGGRPSGGAPAGSAPRPRTTSAPGAPDAAPAAGAGETSREGSGEPAGSPDRPPILLGQVISSSVAPPAGDR